MVHDSSWLTGCRYVRSKTNQCRPKEVQRAILAVKTLLMDSRMDSAHGDEGHDVGSILQKLGYWLAAAWNGCSESSTR